MPGSVRLGDLCSGHGCWPPRVNDQGSPNVFADGIPVHRVGDHWITHCCVSPPYPCHDSVAAQGSPNVFANGKAKCRIGDAVACGSTMVTGSSTVFING